MTLLGIATLAAPYIKSAVGFVAFSAWEYWLGRTKKFAANSTIELVNHLVTAFFKRCRISKKEKIQMEDAIPEAGAPEAAKEMKAAEAAPAAEMAVDKEIKLGSIGKVELDFSHGKAHISISAVAPGDLGVEGGSFVKCDAEKLIVALFAAIEAKSPPGAVMIEEVVKNLVITAVKAIP